MALDLPDKIRRLQVHVGAEPSGELVRDSQYVFTYAGDAADQPAVALLMLPSRQLVYQDGDLFPSMDMNLPEGYLFQRIRELHPKQQLSKMHMLALIGANGIGRVGYRMPGTQPPAVVHMSKADILSRSADGDFFGDLVNAYLSTGAGISGVQPKIMVPSRATTPVPDLIVKTQGPDFAGLAANEFLCLSAARSAGLAVPGFELSQDGTILVLDRFDVTADGTRIGFEDIAALMGKRVHDRLSDRKYQSSYERVAEAIRLVSSSPARDLAAFFEQLTLSVMVRNGDAHLKNFGMLYTSPADVRLSPLFDVVTTAIYTFARPGGMEVHDRTLALKWRPGGAYAAKAYPTTGELLQFGRDDCGVRQPHEVVERIAEAMGWTLREALGDGRIPRDVLGLMQAQWDVGRAYATETVAMRRAGARLGQSAGP